ncbi:Hpt domain-containing protein [Thermodesulfobacteriota bacterium]
MDDYISKPLKRAEFVGMVENCANKMHNYRLNIDDTNYETAVAKPETVLDHKLSIDNQQSKKVSPMNYDKALEEFEGDKEFLKAVIDGFIENVRTQIATIRQAISVEGAGVLIQEAHSIKGGALNLAAEPLSEIAFELEILGKSNKLSGGFEILERFEKEFHRLVEYVKER